MAHSRKSFGNIIQTFAGRKAVAPSIEKNNQGSGGKKIRKIG